MLVYLRNGNSSTLFLACVGRGGQVLEAWWTQVMQQRRKRSKGKLKIKIKVCLPAARQLARHWRATKPTGMWVACRLWNLASGSPTGEQLARILRSCAFYSNSQHIKRASGAFSEEGGKTRKNTHLGHILEPWRAWRTLGKLGIQVGSLERFELSSFVVVYLLPSSSYLFNELLHSFRVCFIYIYV